MSSLQYIWETEVDLCVDIFHTRLDDVRVYAGGSCVTLGCPAEGGLHPRQEVVPISEQPSGTTQRKRS
jgi:hypothetical protein